MDTDILGEVAHELNRYGISIEQANRLAQEGCRIFQMALDLSKLRDESEGLDEGDESWSK